MARCKVLIIIKRLTFIKQSKVNKNLRASIMRITPSKYKATIYCKLEELVKKFAARSKCRLMNVKVVLMWLIYIQRIQPNSILDVRWDSTQYVNRFLSSEHYQRKSEKQNTNWMIAICWTSNDLFSLETRSVRNKHTYFQRA